MTVSKKCFLERTAGLKKESAELDARLIYDEQTLEKVKASTVAQMLTLRSNSHAVKPGVSNGDFREMIVNEMFRIFLDLDDNEEKASQDYMNDIKGKGLIGFSRIKLIRA